MTSPQNDKEVIEAIGLDELVALAGSLWAVQKWGHPERGIPWKFRGQVAQIAKSKRIRLPADFLTSRRAA
jgi:hypothetical protein